MINISVQENWVVLTLNTCRGWSVMVSLGKFFTPSKRSEALTTSKPRKMVKEIAWATNFMKGLRRIWPIWRLREIRGNSRLAIPKMLHTPFLSSQHFCHERHRLLEILDYRKACWCIFIRKTTAVVLLRWATITVKEIMWLLLWAIWKKMWCQAASHNVLLFVRSEKDTEKLNPGTRTNISHPMEIWQRSWHVPFSKPAAFNINWPQDASTPSVDTNTSDPRAFPLLFKLVARGRWVKFNPAS